MTFKFTYEVNLLCQGEGCNKLLTSEPQATAKEAEDEVMMFAENEGWDVTVFLCDMCVKVGNILDVDAQAYLAQSK